jgi:hypothetical protein
MQAEVGDTLTVTGRRNGGEERHGEIVEVQGENGAPPYLVHWQDGTESVVFLRDQTRGSGRELVTEISSS